MACSSLNALIAHAARASSAPGGLDAGVMTIQYATPLIAALLLRLIKLREAHPTLFTFATKDGLANLAAGVVRAGGSLGEARVIMRTFGMLPMLDWLLKLHPKPISALIKFFVRPSLANLDIRNPKVLDTIRVLLLSGFYLGEHVAWLGTKGVLPLSPETIGKAAVFSVRSWAVDVAITVTRLSLQYKSLTARTRALKASSKKTEGYEVAASDEKAGDSSAETSAAAALKAEWATWQQNAMVNFGWIPLTIHWSKPGGLWTNPLITAVIGSYVAYAKSYGVWQRSA